VLVGNEWADGGATRPAQGEASLVCQLPRLCMGTLPNSRSAEMQQPQKDCRDHAPWMVLDDMSAPTPSSLMLHAANTTQPCKGTYMLWALAHGDNSEDNLRVLI